MDAKKAAKEFLKENLGINDFEKAKDAFDRAQATSEGIDYSGGIWSDLKNVVGAAPEYAKDIATGVGNAAVGAGKVVVNVIPAAKARKAADVVLKPFAPKTPSRQFAPKAAKPDAAKPSTKPRYSDDAFAPKKTESKPSDGYPVNPKTKADSAPKAKAPTKKPSKLGRAATFAAGYGLANSDKDKNSDKWTPSAIV
jgi:hypothetical protein